MEDVKSIGIIGNSYVGIALQIASVLKALGKEVMLIDCAEKPITFYTGQPEIEDGDDVLDINSVPYASNRKPLPIISNECIKIMLHGTTTSSDCDMNIFVTSEDAEVLYKTAKCTTDKHDRNFMIVRDFVGVGKHRVKETAKNNNCKNIYYIKPGTKDSVTLLRYEFTSRLRILDMKDTYLDFLYKIVREFFTELTEKDFKKALKTVQKGGSRT